MTSMPMKNTNIVEIMYDNDDAVKKLSNRIEYPIFYFSVTIDSINTSQWKRICRNIISGFLPHTQIML